jgi:hypothetical protein
MALGMAVMGGALAAKAIGGGIAAGMEAKAQRKSLNKYSAALQKQQDSLKPGGISQAAQRSMMTAGALQRSAEGGSLLAQAQRGRGGVVNAADLKAVAEAQAGAQGQQQQALDAMSTQEAQRKNEQRRALQMKQAEVGAQKDQLKGAGWRALVGGAAGAAGQVAQVAAQPAAFELNSDAFAWQEKLLGAEGGVPGMPPSAASAARRGSLGGDINAGPDLSRLYNQS